MGLSFRASRIIKAPIAEPGGQEAGEDREAKGGHRKTAGMAITSRLYPGVMRVYH